MADDEKKPPIPFGLAIAFGLLGGAVVGLLFLDNIGLGAAFGLSFGIMFAVIFGSATKE